MEHATLRADGVSDVLIIGTTIGVNEYLREHGIDKNSPHQHILDLTKFAFAGEADMLCRLLLRHLPGGLFDALLGAMLHAKASVFIVPHDEALREDTEGRA